MPSKPAPKMSQQPTTGYVRTMILRTIEEVRAGQIDTAAANNIAKLAGRLNESLAVEAKMALVLLAAGGKPDALGKMLIGESGDAPDLVEWTDEAIGRHVRNIASKANVLIEDDA